MKLKSLGLAAVSLIAFGAVSTPSLAAEVTLQAASCFPKGSYFSRRLEAYVKQVNEAGKGEVKINYVGGAPAIGKPWFVVQKMSRGVYDLATCTGAYYQNVVPEADAWKMLELTPAEIRKNGGWALMEEIHQAKNLHPLARVHYGTPFHLYLREPISGPNLKGKHLRVAPIYRNFFQALGATTQRSDISQVYTLMENRTVAGFGWPVTGLRPGWEKVTKVRVDPGFYDADIQLMVNYRAWKKLSPKQQDILMQAALAWEKKGAEQDAKDVAAARAKQAKQGYKIVEFKGADRAKWLSVARDAGWAGVIKVSPKNGPKLRKLFTKE